ncbi:hypothetical protein FJ208_01750 [Candidatus Gribaldobacteria bacterium]|nr:hypothetical protein [Candidatus Gribaldobacteria bacterium]
MKKVEKPYLIVAPFPFNPSNSLFKEVYIGDSERCLLGRGMTALVTAFERKADVIAFGGGVLVNEEHESSLEKRAILLNLKSFQNFLPASEDCLTSFIIRHSVADVHNGNDNTEKVADWLCELTLSILREMLPEKKIEVCIITDPSHLLPIYLVSSKLKNFRDKVEISVVLSDIPYSTEEMIILEGPLASLIDDQVKPLIEENKRKAKGLT